MKQTNIQNKFRKKFLNQGVKMTAPETVFFSNDTKIGKNVTIDPYVVIGKKVQINNNVKLREDFRPFAPSVLEEYYQDYFDTNQPSPYMSRIMPVKSDKIPGVTHVDGTARIQTVNRKFNQRYYDVIDAFFKLTGIPMLLNTSFNCQEPIVETPQECNKHF